ncbi:Serine carboxypeptidase ctsa-1.2 [Dirofilaria immitis]
MTYESFTTSIESLNKWPIVVKIEGLWEENARICNIERHTGIYGPTLIDVLLKRIQQNGNLYGIKLTGLAIGNGAYNEAIGNGAYNEVDRRNSILSLSYYIGMLDKE